MIDFDAFNRQLLQSARELLPEWLPGGRYRGAEYVCGSIQGGAGQSFSVNTQTGVWAEFSGDGPKGGDLIALYAAIHGFNQREAALALGATDKPNGHANGHASTYSDVPRETQPLAQNAVTAHPEPAALPPEGVAWAPQDFKHFKHGLPSQFWLYRNAAGQVLYCVGRYDPTPKYPEQRPHKQIVPWVWRATDTGGQWIARGPERPRALYGLPALAASTAPALIVEGERTCDAAARLFPDNPCLTWSGGANAVRHSDWSPLANRACILWPDNDEAGLQAMATLSEILFRQNCTLQIIRADHKPQGWDLADATPEDDIPTYAESHIQDIPRPAPIPPIPRKRPTPAVARAAAPMPVSLDELYARHDFMRKSTGKPYCNEHNVGRAIALLGHDIYYDQFAMRIKIQNDEWSDRHNFELMAYLQRQLEMPDINPKTVRDGVAMYAFSRPRNPLAEWLTSLAWDGVRRVHDLLAIGFGAVPNDYHDAVGRCFLTGMVARVLRPGCQADAMPIFEGSQGTGKSTALRIIGGAYFAEIQDSILSKDFAISLQGKMLCEIAELSAFRTAEIERIKMVIAAPIDRYRDPYGVTSSDHPRQCVFSGTTNRDDWNTDETGARRFWPVTCGQIDRIWLTENREQLFAEAVALFQQGGLWWDVPEVQANHERDARREDDPWEGFLYDTLRASSVVRINDLLRITLQLPIERINNIAMRRVGRILKRHGFRKNQRRDGDATVKEWVCSRKRTDT